jgi:hypothetical protein
MKTSTEKLQIGDRVLVREPWGWHGQQHTPGSVSKKTPTGITTVKTDAYPPNGTVSYEVVFGPDGWERGKRYSGREIVAYDEEVLKKEIYDRTLREKRAYLENYQIWRTASDELILKVAAIVESEFKPSS